MNVPDAITRPRSVMVTMYFLLPSMSSLSKTTELKMTRLPFSMNCSVCTFCVCAPPVMSMRFSITCTSLTGCAKNAQYCTVSLPVFLSYQSVPLFMFLIVDTYDDTDDQLMGNEWSL